MNCVGYKSYKERQSVFLSHAVRYLKEHYLIGGSPKASPCPSKSSMKMKMSLELWWNDTDRETPKYLERTYSPIKNLNDEVRNDK